MNFLLPIILSIGLLLSAPIAAQKPVQTLAEKSFKAVALLFSQNESGGLAMRCTATAFEKTKKGYKFVSAAHCIGDDRVEKERSAEYANIPFYLSFDETHAVKKFYPANVEWVGYQHNGDDFAVFDVETKEEWENIPLGDEKTLKPNAPILNIASPLGLGIQVIHGTISSLFLDRPIVDKDINWRGTMLLSLATVGGGSSGSAVISEEQEAIVGFLVGTIGANNIVAIPVSRLKAAQQAVKDGKYPYVPKGDK